MDDGRVYGTYDIRLITPRLSSTLIFTKAADPFTRSMEQTSSMMVKNLRFSLIASCFFEMWGLLMTNSALCRLGSIVWQLAAAEVISVER